MSTTVKTRNQTALQYFESIQIEYVCAELRTKIYPKTKDREYWKRVMLGKKQKIEDFSERNLLPSIFSDSSQKDFIEDKVYNKHLTTPSFIYRDDEQQQQQEHFDLVYYYMKGVDVRVDIDDEYFVGVVSSYRSFSQTIEVEINGEKKTVPTKSVVRIF